MCFQGIKQSKLRRNLKKYNTVKKIGGQQFAGANAALFRTDMLYSWLDPMIESC